jgi:hypothetical protein
MDFLSLSPDKDLFFKKPLTTTSKQPVTITNSHSEPVAFKIKTTAPKQYCVRPNSGRLAPGESCSVVVLLQAMKEDPPPDFICKDKFLIQAIKVDKELLELDPDAANAKLSNLWTAAENSKKAGMMHVLYEKKLRVVFEEGQSAASGVDVAPLSVNEPLATIATIPNDRPNSFMSINDDALKSVINHKEKELTDAQMKIKSLTASLEQAKMENDRLNQGLKLRKPLSDSVKDSKSNIKLPVSDLKIIPSPLLENTYLVPVEWMILLFVIVVLLIVLLL